MPEAENTRFALLFVLPLLVIGCRASDAELPSAFVVNTTTTPAAAGSTYPNIALAPDGRAVVSWIQRLPEDEFAVSVASYHAQDDIWTEPVTAARGRDWFVNWADFPSVTSDEDGRLYIHWLVKSGPATFAYDVFVSSSHDGGATWTEPKKLHDDDTQTEHGFVSMTPMAGGGALAVWLDGRNFEAGSHRMTLRARTLNADGSFGEEMVIDELVCDCCQTSAVRLSDDRILAVYRNRTDEEIRDVYAAVYDGAEWSAPFPVHADGWRIAGCPVNGPAISSNGRHTAVAWFTGAETAPGVYAAYFDESSDRFGEPVRVDTGNPEGRVDVAMMEDGSAVVVWLERAGGAPAQIMARAVSPEGTLSAPLAVVATTSARAGGFPRIVRTASGIVGVWTDVSGDAPQVRAFRMTSDEVQE